MSLDKILSLKSASPAKEEYWIPLSDLMTGLMLIFLLIAIAFMQKVEADSRRVKDVARIYDEMRNDLYKDLQNEFKNDLPKWGAELDTDLTLRFKEPDVLFDTGKDTLKPEFIKILDNFFPRYVRILTGEKYRTSIEEIRIEGHTSSTWTGAANANNAYFLNMALSQSRTRSTLQYVLSQESVKDNQSWLKSYLTANGLSSSKVIKKADGTEDKEGSQRVEFKVRTNADARINEILSTISK